MRFIVSGVDCEKFGKFLLTVDNDRNVSPVEVIDGITYLSSAYTWDKDKNWALKPLFQSALDKGDLKEADTNYFQVFSIAKMPDSIAFNCPRIVDEINPFSPIDRTKALIEGRSAILRIHAFCKKYLQGFENSYISNISDDLGVRVSRRIKGKYVYKTEDILNSKKFSNVAVVSNYPIDIHSTDKDKSVLQNYGEYQLPLESLMSANYDNLYIVGRGLSADEFAQGALRVQASCMSMGEAVAKDIVSKI